MLTSILIKGRTPVLASRNLLAALSNCNHITWAVSRRLYNDGNRVVDIASKIQRSVAAVYEELKRGSTGELDENKRLKYNADLAQTTVQANIRRRGNKQLNKSTITKT